ncbi:hypothetical protein QPM17_17840 [Marinobacter sp. TBZ242]|uniref:Uncharacterized protein n=1 Tax=Marinobacter azerbaijanicus TaxID=3050455 RepID=A0ABT7IFR4_9GAMM|nr:hypothetical protein [Marinobacter sp. TBZ242]MDL0433009.1 hypothetical protein [Marinobacter sp. TBZ242]
MLFPLHRNTPRCVVFEFLNSELLHFLRASITSVSFSQDLFSSHDIGNARVPSVCWSNIPTQNKFRAVWNNLPQRAQERQRVYDIIHSSQDIDAYFDDTAKELPQLNSPELSEALKDLTIHLFTRTKDLEGTKTQANGSIGQHFQQFIHVNNDSELCPLCGTARLSQNRAHLGPEDQWRADYDHLLCKDRYPIFGAHPGNFIPTCHICNSKAKGARDLLREKDGHRRRAFYPLPPSQDFCYQYLLIEVTPKVVEDLVNGEWEEPLSETVVSFESAPQIVKEKIEVWDEVYKVVSRVEHHITTYLCERVASDLRAMDYADFRAQLSRFSAEAPADWRSMEWRFWWHRVYEYLNRQNEPFLQDLWSLIDWKQKQVSDQEMSSTFDF